MDRGYDSEAIHRQIREDLQATLVIQSVPGITRWSEDRIVRKWRNSSMMSDTREDNLLKTSFLS
jgi:hypothetical protein